MNGETLLNGKEAGMMEHGNESTLFKTLGEPSRLRILDMLSCGEMCACDLLKHLSISQSTLSHHMKALVESGLVTVRRSASWMHYSIDTQRVEELNRYFQFLTRPKDSCSCEAAGDSAVEDPSGNACS